jgi:RNA polymerase sigma-B factor
LSETKDLFEQYRKSEDPAIKDVIVQKHYNLVIHVSKKFLGRGESLEDLIQVGMLGMLKALNNYDPSFNAEFATYAMPMIIGEIKHYFRDYARLVKLPRRIHELNSQVKRIVFEYHQYKDRSPTIAELAEQVGCSEEEVLEAMEAGEATKALSLDAPAFVSERSGEVVTNSRSSLLESLGMNQLESRVLDRETLKYAIANLLNRREQRIIYMRFYDNLSQQEIANYLNLSQMHVSRLLKHAIAKLKKYIVKDDTAA